MTKKTLASASHNILRKILRSYNRNAGINEVLGGIVTSIAQELGVDVCSCYLLKNKTFLELYATFGLDASAVHKTSIRIGEGVVGEVAATKEELNLKNAWKHPKFLYLPETKEEMFKSFMGVPIMKDETLLGVLCVQTKTARSFPPGMVEILKTLALFTADIAHNSNYDAPVSAPSPAEQERNHLFGIDIVKGIGVGKAWLHRRFSYDYKQTAENVDSEIARLDKSLQEMQSEISKMLDKAKATEGEHLDILDSYFMFSNDKAWVSKIQESIKTGLSAEASAQKVFNDMETRLSKASDPYIKERLADLRDLTTRLLKHLSGNKRTVNMAAMPKSIVLFATGMGPSELFDYEFGRIKGIVMAEGSKTMHIAIIARSLNIPIVGGIEGVMDKVKNEDNVIVDGTHGEVHIKPSEEIIVKFEKTIKAIEEKSKLAAKGKFLPNRTLDGINITLNINAGLLIDMESLPIADGVGLYRTELPFMMSSKLPDVDAQTSIYRSVYKKAAGKPIIFRTLDIGADKILDYFHGIKEENPAMGWRSVRVSLDRKALFRQQLRALVRATEGEPLNVMFPMVTNVAEFKTAKNTLLAEIDNERKRRTQLPSKIRIGTMIEVPSLMFQLDTLLPLVDFVSVGTNDLTQFIFACDRGNPSVYERYDVLSPAMLNVLSTLMKKCTQYGVQCSICGEIAGNPLDAMVLVGLGFRSLSMNPLNVIGVKEMLHTLDTRMLSEYIKSFEDSSYPSLREAFRNFAVDHGINVDFFNIK